MGYTHYWRRKKEFDLVEYKKVVSDFKKVVPFLQKMSIKLAGGMGKGQPEITSDNICFNGLEKCGHSERELGITWPAKNAKGISLVVRKESDEQKELPEKNGVITTLAHHPKDIDMSDSDVAGQWFAGAQLNSRTCGGDCSHETFSLPMNMKPSEWAREEKGKYFEFCKTAYKPYDLAVNICLIIAKHYLKEDIIISSDGELDNWSDAIFICKNLVGYGKDFTLAE